MSFKYASWPMPANVRAGWTTRKNGFSSQPYNSFNIAHHVGDMPDRVNLNRQLLSQQLQGSPNINWLNQTHSTVVVEVPDVNLSDGQDAIYTRSRLQACTVMTADCLPVFFWDAKGEQVAVAHAGWRGLAEGILLKTLNTFAEPQSVYCGIGPAIGQNSFEVGVDVKAAFETWANIDPYFSKLEADGQYLCDLSGLAREQLLSAGVRHVYLSNLCTFEVDTAFYSYRREGQTGRMANIIWMQNDQ